MVFIGGFLFGVFTTVVVESFIIISRYEKKNGLSYLHNDEEGR